MPHPAWSLLPNSLTVSRLALGIALPWVPVGGQFWVLLIAGFTDLIDGWISRRLGVTSWFGQLIDPIADKTLVLVAVGCAWHSGWLSPFDCGLLAARDFAVLAISAAALLWHRANWRKLQPRLSGKLAMGGQIAALLGVYWVQGPCPTLVLIGGVLSVIAAVDYTMTGWRLRG